MRCPMISDPQQPREMPHRGGAVLRTQLDMAQALCRIAVEAWRLSGLLPRLCETDRPRVQGAVERLCAHLQQAGVTIEDRTSQAYVEGLAVEVLAVEERPDLPPDNLRILETIKPSVYIAGQLASPGQVILGRGVAKATGSPDGTRND
jgi:hypothetical protein